MPKKLTHDEDYRFILDNRLKLTVGEIASHLGMCETTIKRKITNLDLKYLNNKGVLIGGNRRRTKIEMQGLVECPKHKGHMHSHIHQSIKKKKSFW